MKINYDEIITKANERAEKIKEFVEYAADADQHATSILNGLLYFANLKNRAMAVDGEGKQMIGAANVRAQQVGAYATDVYRFLTTTDGSGSDSRCILRLVEALEHD